MIRFSPPPVANGDQASFTEHFLETAASAIGYIRARVELAGIEGREAAAIYGKVVAFLAAAAGLLVFGYVFLWIGLIAVATHFLSLFWGWAVLAAALLHIIAAGLFAAIAIARWGKPVFPVTLTEFRKDQEWLNKRRQTERHS